jgi:hypothetical protein
MRLGLTRRERFLTGAPAWLLAGGILLAVAGCSAEMTGVMFDSLQSALESVIPGMMDMLRDCGTNGDEVAPVSGANGFLPVTMREAAQTAWTLLA